MIVADNRGFAIFVALCVFGLAFVAQLFLYDHLFSVFADDDTVTTAVLVVTTMVSLSVAYGSYRWQMRRLNRPRNKKSGKD
ncbi:MAG: hypothetical protein AAF787_21915 [Chloroflexota bacterium]